MRVDPDWPVGQLPGIVRQQIIEDGLLILYYYAMTTWYILPNGNIKHVNGLELQPEEDWFPTAESMALFTEQHRASGQSDVQIIKHMMDLARDGEKWVQDNLSE